MAAREVERLLTGRNTVVEMVPQSGQVLRLDNIAQTREGWILSRAWAASEYFSRIGVSGVGPQGYKRIAAVSLVLWANESGWGEAEYNWNAGGIHCNPSASPTAAGQPTNPLENDSCIVFPGGSRESLRAYQDFGNFLWDFSRVAENLFGGYWSVASSGQVSAVDRLQRAGYVQSGNYLTAQELVSIYRRIYNTVNDAWRRDLVRPEEQVVTRASGGGGGATSGGTVAVLGLGLGLFLLSEKG